MNEDVAGQMTRIEQATADLPTPLAVLDLPALRANTADLRRRADGMPIRVASKSIRCREVLRWVLDQPGYEGVLAFTLPEALWLAGGDDPVSEDVLVAYPTVDREALHRLAGDAELASRVTVMLDSVEGLDATEAAIGHGGHPVQVCLDLDASLRLAGGRVHLGVRRSPVHSVAEIRALAEQVAARDAFRLVGVMSYEAQVAGLGDEGSGVLGRAQALAVRGVQSGSVREIRSRRGEAVAAVRSVADLRLVNGGGTGSLESTATDPSVTEAAAGSGLFGPTLFDSYRAFTPTPAVFFAAPVVRRPTPDIATVLGGGWIASGPPGQDRLPTPCWPPGLRLLGTEGAGEVQTPVSGAAARDLRIGDRVWFRHAKSGEVCEHVTELVAVDSDGDRQHWPTYRGEGQAFV